ncbi:pyridoxine/pyridoxamine 5'-phosphate oxidase [Aestuariimicrobium soli]|uniref:pyridoxine/pyridoxamine 5'-phosphate oxidase n=1 Tax=Aestuariimicrobium soli TaxID=2035834 RepID=UPI003EBCA7FC
MDDLRQRLRALPSFPDDLPVLDPSSVPDDPAELFAAWLDDAIASGARQPHAMDLVTLRPDGSPDARVLILKDVDERGYHFSSHRTSTKGVELAGDARAALVFFWRESGRSVRIDGIASPLDEATSQADWRARPSFDGRPNTDWQVWALAPHAFEFLQARHDRRHTRLGYTRSDEGWRHAPVTTPAG